MTLLCDNKHLESVNALSLCKAFCLFVLRKVTDVNKADNDGVL